MQTKRENKLNQQKYRDSMKSKGLKMVVIPLLERDIQTATRCNHRNVSTGIRKTAGFT